MTKINLNIDCWRANAAGLNTLEQWKDWTNNNQWPQDEKIAVDKIPAMMRRRMSNLSKLATQTALQLLETQRVDYIVFSSRHGELTRTAKLIESILQGEDASPMDFSQSVHNTAAGLTTIAAKQPLPVSSISASDNSFHMALVEAYIYLHNNPDHKVLLVDFDEPLPEIYKQFDSHYHQGYSLGLILSYGDEFTINNIINSAKNTLPQSLEFLHNYLTDKSTWTVHSSHQSWQWIRKTRS
ncbi:beta-ketoacyl synthase chain length factor [Vibrio hippocampi]|uniref:Beta-ketoacyl synthase-like N-terminal domain-containing protein n=1 Tax=Vibrio hippocampi TaxID=654686 RepID=A0ABM8ZLD7_9VIBR|nr:beta-ketoacyl synthase chain length factor [Vibrio hippocampi]CAH0529187.1 hypothetical protein VHP8226_03094 [Vibrio hippocampi]